MVKENYYNIVNGLEVKANLLAIKEALKDVNKGGREKEALIFAVKDDISVLVGLLKNEDPKIRKNTAVILGILGIQEAAAPLYEGYCTDETKYNKGAYLEALKKLDYSAYKEDLKRRFEELKSLKVAEEDKKHILEEMKQLKSIFGTGRLEFIGYNLLNECVLLTNRNFKKLTADALGSIPHKEFTAGVMCKTKNLKKVLPIRTYEELLFIPDGIKTVDSEPAAAASQLVEGGIQKYIFDRVGILNAENADYNVKFRIDLRGSDALSDNGFAKKLSGELELLTNWALTNSVSDYDVEIRLVRNSSGKLNVLVRFALLKDSRFSYRKEKIAATMKPYLAATIMKLAEPYFIRNAAVLDPFCGVGTLLAEREIACNARLYYGIDIFGEAVEKAAVNLKLAGVSRKTELITRDFFEFEHEYRFDEVITDMPFVTGKKTEQDIEKLYKAFFRKIPSLLEKDATLIIYTRNEDLLKKYSSDNGFKVLADFEFSKMEGSYLYILEYVG